MLAAQVTCAGPTVLLRDSDAGADVKREHRGMATSIYVLIPAREAAAGIGIWLSRSCVGAAMTPCLCRSRRPMIRPAFRSTRTRLCVQ
jgi:hypothetical protein